MTNFIIVIISIITIIVSDKQVKGENELGLGNTSILAIIGTLAALFIIIVVTVAAIVYRRRLQGKLGRKNEERKESGIDLNDLSGYANAPPAVGSTKRRKKTSKRLKLPSALALRKSAVGGIESPESDGTYQNLESGNTAVSVENLKTYILQHSAGSKLQDEFASVPQTNGSPQTVAVLRENVKKNRYKNIIPCKCFVLRTPHDFKGNKAFIASQGPNDKMIDDFVRMLWEQRVDKIVMLTNLVEEAKVRYLLF
ncbi:receptor-type tyrosine-protein phosphatase eta [Elysia marginata]|uniref:protein-tyrosine-phosphatase n=1 Tax=Elysia marginata TaxID=1093978 RepID=A0AAV4HPQ9_9GAST|nr:receptor-type tyrosine-protein phosphatase eta [Elysia marginata]